MMKQKNKSQLIILGLVINLGATIIVLFSTGGCTPGRKNPSSIEPLDPSNQLEALLLGNVKITKGNKGTFNLRLSENQVAIGAAEKFQDVIDEKNPPFTVFVIYGEADITVTLQYGGWDLWEDANEAFIQNQISEKIEEVKETDPINFDTRGYRVIRCYSQVITCETDLSLPDKD